MSYVVIDSRLKHGALWKLVEQYGTQKAVAERLGITQMCIGNWLSFKYLPSKRTAFRGKTKRRKQLEEALGREGLLWEDVFPEQSIYLNPKQRRKTHTTNIDIEQLHAGLSAPDSSIAQLEHRETIDTVLKTIGQREAFVIRRKFGLDGDKATLREAGQELGISRARAAQMAICALAELRRRVRQLDIQASDCSP